MCVLKSTCGDWSMCVSITQLYEMLLAREEGGLELVSTGEEARNPENDKEKGHE